MRNFIIKLFILFAFILNFMPNVKAAELNINSVTFDNSASFMTINSTELNDFTLNSKPLINKIENENSFYFDMPSANMNCAPQNFVLKSGDISEIHVFQYSKNPDIVRVQITHAEGFNPTNLRLKKSGNTIFVQFKYPSINNYYFQPVALYSSVQPFMEQTEIQMQVPDIKRDNIFSQINASFGEPEASSYVLTDKNMLLRTKFYIDDITFKGSIPVITGIGSYSLSKPIYLTNPSRVAYDIPNSIVNPVIRNQEIPLGHDEILRIGQFDMYTSRIVITSPNPEKYIPVIYPDSQRLVFFDSKNENPLNLYSSLSNLKSVKYEKIDSLNSAAKFVFNKPLVLGINRKSANTEIYLYNAGISVSDIIAEFANTPFENILIDDIGEGTYKLTFHDASGTDIYLGADGKTLRIKEKFKSAFNPTKQEEIIVPSIPEKIRGKRYVMIDPGHGGADVGATRNNIYEKDITLDISQRVETLLKKKGYIVEMTRYNDQTVSLQERVDMSELFNPDIFVSIHVNSSNSETPYGLETHYYKENSLMLAKYVHAALLNNVNTHDRGLFKSKFYVINHTTAPAILVETGFISNPSERSQLVSESRKNATAKAIAEGIDEYFKQY